MPYPFPHEDLFLVAVGALIVGLLLLRVRLARRRRRSAGTAPGAPPPI
jgi:hypothetical protein